MAGKYNDYCKAVGRINECEKENLATLKKRWNRDAGCASLRSRDSLCSGGVMLDLRSRLLDSQSEAPPIPVSRHLSKANPAASKWVKIPDSRRAAPPERSVPDSNIPIPERSE